MMRPELVAVCCMQIEFTLKPGKKREFACSFGELSFRAGADYIKTTVYEDRDEPGHMMWALDLPDRETAEEYVRSEAFGVLIGGLSVLSTKTSCRLLSVRRTLRGSKAVLPWRVLSEGDCAEVDLSEPDGGSQ